ncbi:uncharacterized protein BYT42DRAFT_479246, partial [Radiomyces spectabilis]|uniref:uncharacterized protein n=1 Tax=Radiomyces spectabilis TaxID=64574 RepID=UPI002220F15B
LKTKLLCEHVFASYNTNASDPISARDANSKPSSIPQFQDSSGTMQDMMETITKSPKKIRLVVIDYAGLTTDPDDLKWFMQANKQIEEVVVDIGHKVEIYSRKDLKKESILQKFNCRTSCVKRSK